jgi:hypothetical protein
MTLPAYRPAHADWTHGGRLRGPHPLVALGAALRGGDDSSGPCRLDFGIVFTSGQCTPPIPPRPEPRRAGRGALAVRSALTFPTIDRPGADPIYQKKQATAQQAEAVVDALMKVFDQPLFEWARPRVMVDTWEHGRTVVVWEEGLYGWTSVFPCGGMLNGTLWEVPEAVLPKGVLVEPDDGCVVSVYQEVAEQHSAEIRGKRFASSPEESRGGPISCSDAD